MLSTEKRRLRRTRRGEDREWDKGRLMDGECDGKSVTYLGCSCVYNLTEWVTNRSHIITGIFWGPPMYHVEGSMLRNTEKD